MSPIAERAAAWLLAYAIHSTLLLGAPLDALPVLVRIAWRHPQLDVRRQAAETLGHLRGGAGRAALDSIIFRHPDPEVREEARDALRNR